MNPPSRKVMKAGREIQRHLAELQHLFVPTMRLTSLARATDTPSGECDMVVTSDDLEAVERSIRLLRLREEIELPRL